jgi:hypothetical protein
MLGGRHLPFSPQAFLSLFETYNLDIWPAQIAAYALGILAVVLVFRPRRSSARIVGAILVLLWLWTGIVYHGLYFTPLNFFAPVFAALFVVQALLYAWQLVLRSRLEFRFERDAVGYGGLVLVALSMVVYPLISVAVGHTWPRMPVFGVAPCPTSAFTLGILLMARPKVPMSLLVIPLFWSLVGAVSAWLLAMHEDWILPFAGIATIALLLLPRRRTG